MNGGYDAATPVPPIPARVLRRVWVTPPHRRPVPVCAELLLSGGLFHSLGVCSRLSSLAFVHLPSGGGVGVGLPLSPPTLRAARGASAATATACRLPRSAGARWPLPPAGPGSDGRRQRHTPTPAPSPPW